MADAVPRFTPGISVADAHFMLRQLAEANLKPDETEQRWTFKHPELLELPAECRSSLLVHGHRAGIVRFKKLLLACNGARWANMSVATVIAGSVFLLSYLWWWGTSTKLKGVVAAQVKMQDLLTFGPKNPKKDDAISPDDIIPVTLTGGKAI
ncbi:hypothetical protein ABBQ38_006387 [Trebouxia sp. C0009 RCD-2024]